MSILAWSASARNCGSCRVASKARRSAATRSGGVSGVVTAARESTMSADMNCMTARSASLAVSSVSSGTSANSGCRRGPIWTRMWIFFSAIHCGRVDFHEAQELEPRPPTSPRSIAKLTSLPPGYPVMILNLVPITAFITFG
jgi:hypothetical protein